MNTYRNGIPSQVLNPDFNTRVAAGLVPGWTFERKFGSIDAIQSAVEASVWEYGVTVGAEQYTFSSTADIDTISSSNAGDSVTMTIVGLDADGYEVTQNATLNGTTKVTLTTPLWRVNRVFNSNAVDLLGNVYVYVDDTTTTPGIPDDVTKVRGYVSAGEGQTLQTVYTLPRDYMGYFMGLEASLTKGAAGGTVSANLRGRTRSFNKVFRTRDEFNLLSGASSSKTINFPVPIPFEPRTDFCPCADVSANDVGVSWAYTILLHRVDGA